MAFPKTRAVLKGLADGIPGNNLFIMAAGLSYYFVISLFPGLVLLTAIVSFLPLPGVSNQPLDVLTGFIPASEMERIARIMQQAVIPNRGWLISAGAIGIIWTASSAFSNLKTAIAISYEAPDNRPFWITRPIAIGLTLSIGLLFLVAFAVLTVGPQFGSWLASHIGLSHVIAIVWPTVRWIVAIAFAVFSIVLLYYIAPQKEQRLLDTLPGAVLSVCMWLGLTYLLGFYFRDHSPKSAVYGSFAGAIAFLIWLYWAGFAVLVGAQLNAEIERVRRRESEIQTEQRGPRAVPAREIDPAHRQPEVRRRGGRA